MKLAKRVLNHFPRIKSLLKSFYLRLQWISPNSKISKEILRECIGKENPTILDIGCNDGTDSLWFFEVFKNPTVYCFEPDPRAISRFKEKVCEHPNISLFELALCDYDGEVEFYQSGGHGSEEHIKAMPQGWDLSGSIRQPKDHLTVTPWVKFDQKITVKASTLDSWCNEYAIESIDFIWMDVQGAEIDVFRGGGNTLAKTRFLYTEYSNQELYKGQFNLKELRNFLKSFDVVIRYQCDVLFRNKQLTKGLNKRLLRIYETSRR